jgi:hypothetical protein
MTLHDIDTVLGWRGRAVRDRDGEKIGTFGDVYLDGRTDRPAWAGVKTGLFGMSESLVPLEGIEDTGEELLVPWEKALVKDAPNVGADVDLDEEGEERLFAHYGHGAVSAAGAPVAGAGDVATPEAGAAEVVRHEEEPVVTDRVERRPAERVRLKKVLVTEHVEQTVPVQREVVEVVEDPPATRGDAA